jgi:hypothetical protein
VKGSKEHGSFPGINETALLLQEEVGLCMDALCISSLQSVAVGLSLRWCSLD